MTKFDSIIIGAGPGGYVSAIRMAQNGLKVCLIEANDVGGTCLNRGCIPTKSLLHSAELANHAREAAKYGVATGEVSVDFSAVVSRRDEVVLRLRTGVEKLVESNGITLVRGKARFTNPLSVEVTYKNEKQLLTADNIVIATGSVPSMPPIEGIEYCVNSDYLLEGSSQLPNKIVIVGGGVIGVEFASAFSAYGREITIIEFADKLVSMFDRDVSLQLALNLKKQGVKINLSSKVTKVEKQADGLIVSFTDKAGDQTERADMVVVCVGRRANINGLGAEEVGIATERGKIAVDKFCKTSQKNVYAIGDCTGGIMLAHYASAQGVAVAEMISGKQNHTNLEVVPSCVYTSPEIASVGLTAAECEAKGIEVEIGKFPMGANGKAVIVGEDKGFVKTVFEKSSGKLLGATLYCTRATDLIGEFALAVANNMTRKEYLHGMKPHPTVVEALFESVEDSEGMAIHAAPKRK